MPMAKHYLPYFSILFSNFANEKSNSFSSANSFISNGNMPHVK